MRALDMIILEYGIKSYKQFHQIYVSKTEDRNLTARTTARRAGVTTSVRIVAGRCTRQSVKVIATKRLLLRRRNFYYKPRYDGEFES